MVTILHLMCLLGCYNSTKVGDFLMPIYSVRHFLRILLSNGPQWFLHLNFSGLTGRPQSAQELSKNSSSQEPNQLLLLLSFIAAHALFCQYLEPLSSECFCIYKLFQLFIGSRKDLAGWANVLELWQNHNLKVFAGKHYNDAHKMD